MTNTQKDSKMENFISLDQKRLQDLEVRMKRRANRGKKQNCIHNHKSKALSRHQQGCEDRARHQKYLDSVVK